MPGKQLHAFWLFAYCSLCKFLKNDFVSHLMCCISFVHMCVCVPPACLVLTEVKRRYQIPGTGVMDGCKPPCEFGEPSPSPLQEHQVLLTTEPCLSPLTCCVTIPCTCYASAQHLVRIHTTLRLYLCTYLHAFAFGQPLNSWRAGMDCLPL